MLICIKPIELVIFHLKYFLIYISGKKSESNPHILKDDFRENAKSL